MATLEEKLQDLLLPVIEDFGCELWGIEVQRVGRFLTLRIFIDKPETGVTIDDCADVSRQISALLDVEDPIADKYNLEVSSPGMDRPLFTLPQFSRYIGQEIVVHLRIPMLNRRKWQGKLVDVQNDMLSLEVDGFEDDEMPKFAFSNIQKAHIVPQF